MALCLRRAAIPGGAHGNRNEDVLPDALGAGCAAQGYGAAKRSRAGFTVLLLGWCERLVDAIANARSRHLDRIAGEVCVAGGDLHLSVARELSVHGKALAERHRARGEAVPEVVQPDVVGPGEAAGAAPLQEDPR